LEEFGLIFVLLTITTSLTLYILHTCSPTCRINTLSVHLAVVEVSRSPINEVCITVIVPKGKTITFEKNVIIIIGDIVDSKVLAFNCSMLKNITKNVIVYNPSKVWFTKRVTLFKTSLVKLINRFGKINVIPIGGEG